NTHALQGRVALREYAIALETEPRRHDDLVKPADSVDRQQVVDVSHENMLGQIGTTPRPTVTLEVVLGAVQKEREIAHQRTAQTAHSRVEEAQKDVRLLPIEI